MASRVQLRPEMSDELSFYIGKQGALYLQRENGSLARFGLRVSNTGTLIVFDQLTRRWYELPAQIPDRSGGHVTIIAQREGVEE